MGLKNILFGERSETSKIPPIQQRCYFDVDENKLSHIAIINRCKLDFISHCILDYPNIETVGQLFVFWTSDGTPIVTYVIGLGTNVQHHQTRRYNQNLTQLFAPPPAFKPEYFLSVWE